MTFKECPCCGHKHDNTDTVCPYCKHSYSEKKIVCNNCGAYLQLTDKICYVCGQVVENQPLEVINSAVINEELEKIETEPSENNSEQEIKKEDTYKEIVDEDMTKHKKQPKGKKAGLICAIIIIVVALLGAGICLCFFNGWGIFANKQGDEPQKNTLYFDKPSANQNLMDLEGTVYNWTGDVDINYTLNGQSVKKACKMTLEYDNIWYSKVPKDAVDIYFSESTLGKLRTTKLYDVYDENIYYVSDILLDDNMQLPVMFCSLSKFDKMGINYTQQTTETETSKQTESTAETKEVETTGETETETETNAESAGYNISLPKQWQDNITVVENGNCTNYYESYNYTNYQCGNLISVYVFEANDNSYSEMNVQKVVPSSDGTKKIVIVTPTDIQFNDSDEDAIEKYTSLSQFTSQVVNSITAK